MNNKKILRLLRNQPIKWKRRRLNDGYQIKCGNKQIYLYRSLTSTNDTAKELGESGIPEAVIWSQYQLQGRGRFTRSWLCPQQKGLLFSMLIRPEIKANLLPLFTLFAAIIAVKTIKPLCASLPLGIKWPNDILLADKKLVGILAEASFSGANLNYLVLGIGINANLDFRDFSPGLQAKSTSIKIETGHLVSRLRLLRSFIANWERHYHEFRHNGFDFILPHWEKCNITTGKRVILNKQGQNINGIAIGINDSGGLIIKDDCGDIYELYAEEIELGQNMK